MAFLMGFIVLLLVGGMIAQSARSRVVPFVIAVDNLGRVAGEGRAEQASPVDQRVVRAALLDWMTSLRSITSDVYLQRRFIDDVYAKMVKSSAAFNVVSDSYKQNSPFEHGQNQTVSVDVHAITPLSPSSYEITWWRRRAIVREFWLASKSGKA